ncbi:hypothetical protein HKCCSP123_04650 [Rhodobacterales bacterium HKCCSP123]|nr:hypothetical protein [Rhodobacterales bacterium HKCCSP123]
MPTRDSPQGQFVRQNFGRIWPAHLEAFSRLLRALRDSFDGDLDLLVILLAIAERTPVEAWVSEALSLRELMQDLSRDLSQRPINIQSVADFTGIPRETVRRKIMVLRRRGWIARHANGHLSVTPKAAADLEGATGHSVAYIAALFIAYEEVADREA